MANIKYFLEYSDINGIISRLEIWDKTFEGDPTEINGNVTLNYAERKDLLQYSVPASLDINLEADEEITLQDLYSEAENQYQTKYFIDGQLVFFGILKPDGIWEDWVNLKWEISIDAMDGLSILKDLSFVKDDGTFYEGKITQFDALKQCLNRIGYNLPINVSNDLPTYVGFADSDSILHNILMNAERFYQDAQKNNIMNCEEVLKSILEPYNATLFQMNGEWWVVRSLDFKAVMSFKKYNGFFKSDIIWNSEYFIGSDTNNFPIHHVNANQKRSVNPSAQAFRVNYKYGTVKSISENSELKFNSGFDIDGWIVNPGGTSGFNRLPGSNGFYINRYVYDYIQLIKSDQPINVLKNDSLDITFNFANVNVDLSFPYYRGDLKMIFKFETANFILDEGVWISKPGNEGANSDRTYDRNAYNITQEFSLPPIPEDGNLQISMFVYFLENINPNSGLIPPAPRLEIYSIDIKPNQNNNYKGEFHTAQRSTRVSSVTKNDKTVSVGDSESDIYLGTLYKDNGEPTELWNRSGMTDNKSLLRLMVEDTLRISPRPMMYFEGDIYGYVPFMALIDIDNNEGKYQISKYSYNSVSGINRTAFKEFSTDLLDDTLYRYEFEYDYGNVTTVSIVS